jgi:hypothetical protein
LKLSPVESVLEDQRVVVVDDSIVRGTTSQKIVRMLRETGVEEVHFRVASPQTTNPCYYGIDTPEREELIAASHTEDEICEHVTADTLSYLSIDGLRSAVDAEIDDEGNSSFCEACFTGDYPIPTHQDSTPESTGRHSGSNARSGRTNEGSAARTQPVEEAAERVSGENAQVGPPPEAQGGKGEVRPEVDAAVHFDDEE